MFWCCTQAEYVKARLQLSAAQMLSSTQGAELVSVAGTLASKLLSTNTNVERLERRVATLKLENKLSEHWAPDNPAFKEALSRLVKKEVFRCVHISCALYMYDEACFAMLWHAMLCCVVLWYALSCFANLGWSCMSCHALPCFEKIDHTVVICCHCTSAYQIVASFCSVCSLNVQLSDMIKDYATLHRQRDRQGETCQETKSLKSRMKKKRSRMVVVAGQMDAWSSLLGDKVTTAQTKLDSWIAAGKLPDQGGDELHVGRLLCMASHEVRRAKEEKARLAVEAQRHLVWNDYMTSHVQDSLVHERSLGTIQPGDLSPDTLISSVVYACAAAPNSIGRQLWLNKNLAMLRRMKARMLQVIAHMDGNKA